MSIAASALPPVGEHHIMEAIAPLRAEGFALHWLRARSKAPIVDAWSEAPVASLADLRRTHRTGANVGARLGEPSQVGGGYLHVIDMDIRIADLADEAWAALRALFPGVDLDSLPCVQSGSGGESRHLYLITGKPFRSKKLATSDGKHRRTDGRWSYDWEVELFGTGKQVVLPPSVHPDTGQPYLWLRPFDFTLLDLGEGPFVPSPVIERLAVAEHSTYEFETRDPLTFTAGQLDRVLASIPMSDLDYDDWIRLGQAIHHQTGGSTDGLNLWLEHSRRSKKFTGAAQEREMRRIKWRSFGKYRGQPVTMATVVEWSKKALDLARAEALNNAFDEEDEPDAPAPDAIDAIGSDHAEPSDVPEFVFRLNRRHAIARVTGKTVVLSERDDGRVDYGTVADLHHFYENVRSPTEQGRSEPVTKAWMRHPSRRSYPDGIVFAPSGARRGQYNLWKGFSVEPDPNASCVLFLSHLRDVACGGDQETYEWVVRWFAHMVQRPWEKPGTALVLRGQKGTGKDTIGDYVGGLFPRHHTKIANAEHLHGRFNAHQEQTLLLHVEEGFWAGDKKAEGAFKHLITSEQVQIEPKGVNAFQVASVLRVFISSNEQWVVPATGDERRFCVLNVSGRRAGEAAYFQALRDEMNGGGRAGLLHHLQSVDLTGFNVRKPPETEGLGEQKLQSLRNVERWWFEKLSLGSLPGAQSGFDDDDGDAAEWSIPIRTPCATLRADYREWMKEQRFEGALAGEQEFGRRLRTLCPAISARRPRDGGLRTRQYEVPALEDCRAAFNRQLVLRVNWSDTGEV